MTADSPGGGPPSPLREGGVAVTGADALPLRRIGIVNRGEPAMRFLVALDALRRERPDAPHAVALYTDADHDALFVRTADASARIGSDRQAYLDAPAVLDALRRTRCDSAWLGWGFASEDEAFARALEDAGITLLAPRSETMGLLGDKIRAKRLAEQHGVPVSPWAVVSSPEEALAESARVGFPLVIKAAGGGGGRGIRRVDEPGGLAEALAAASGEASRSFGSGGLYLERCLTEARHVEVQVLGDGRGGVLVLGVRDCSLQRRRQKVIEECRAPNLPIAIEDALLSAAARLCRAVAYRSAGTVEFLYQPRTDSFCFLEVNTRLQVEHPVTEEVYGVDLVRWQIDLAMGRPLPTVAPVPRGWAFEARLCAEDARNDFLPTPGRLVRFVPPAGPGVRVDTGFTEGDEISANFDSLVAKIIAWGPTRPAALARLARALEQTRVVVEGGRTNLDFLRRLVERPEVRTGDVDIGLVDRVQTDEGPGAGAALLAAAIDRFVAQGDRASDAHRHRVDVGQPIDVYRVAPERFRLVGRDGAVTVDWRAVDAYQCWLTVAGRTYRIERAPGDTTYVVDGTPHLVAQDAGGAVLAPAEALVLELCVRPGDAVVAGQTVAILESMKMEVRVTATLPGCVREVRARAGGQVHTGQVLCVLETSDVPRTSQAGPLIPWSRLPPDPSRAARRLTRAIVGWDLEPGQFAADLVALAGPGCLKLLGAFADVAELFERRPLTTPEAGDGAPEAVDASEALEALRTRGADVLPAEWRLRLARALGHHEVEHLRPGPALDDACLRLERARANLVHTAPAAIAALAALDAVPIKLLDRLAAVERERLPTVAEAADRARYVLYERPAYERLTEESAARARTLLDRLRAGETEWAEVLDAAESLVPGMALPAAQGCLVAAQAVARRLEWQSQEMPFAQITLADRVAWRVGGAEDAVVVVSAWPHEAPALLAAARAITGLRRMELLLVRNESSTDADTLLRECAQLAGVPERATPAESLGASEGADAPYLPWAELCVIVVGEDAAPRVRRWLADGRERLDRRDILPTTARRFDLDRLSRFTFERVPAEDDIVLFHAVARENPDDVRLLAYGEIRSLRRRPGRPLHLPHVDRVFHAAVRAIQAAREQLDPRRRLLWNRLTLVVLPVVPMGPEVVRRYVGRLAPAAERAGLEKVVVRARFADPAAPGGVSPLMDLAIGHLSGQGLVFTLHPASHKALLARTRYESRVVEARRRGLIYPYELIHLLEGSGRFPPGRFEEHDLDVDGASISVAHRPRGENTAAVVFGLIRTRISRGLVLERVLIVSDPTRHMGALAEPECRRVIAALDLAAAREVPVEWVATSSGARIDWSTGTENLDWTARVLHRIVRFTQSGGQIDVLVPGVCVGAQAYWNAEATMLMHTRGLLVMTDHGAMVLTGKRALDASGCVSADDDLALGGFVSVMGPNGQAQAWARDLTEAYRLLYRYHKIVYVPPGERRPPRAPTRDPSDRDICSSPYPADLDHGFTTVGQIFSREHNPDRKRPFAVRPVMAALIDREVEPVDRWGAMRGGETAVIWEARLGGYAATLIGVDNQPVERVGKPGPGGPTRFAGATLYPQASRKVARALNAASGRRPAVVLANLSGFDGSPESLRDWQLEYGAEIGRAVVNFDGPILFVVLSRYHGGAYVVFSKALNPRLRSVAIEGSFASVIGGAPAATVVFAGEVRRQAALAGGDEAARRVATQEVAARFDAIHTVARAQAVGSIDEIIAPSALRPYLISALEADRQEP